MWDKQRGGEHTFSDCELVWTNIAGIVVKKYEFMWDGYRRQGPRTEEGKKRVHPNQKGGRGAGSDHAGLREAGQPDSQPVRRLRVDDDSRREGRPALLHGRIRPPVLQRYHQSLAGFYGVSS